MSSYTPGPWKIFDGWGSSREKPIIVDSIPDDNGKFVGNCICFVATTNDDAAANARLLAAAPDMLAALEDALRTCDQDMQHVLDNGRLRDVIRAALAKAKGAGDE